MTHALKTHSLTSRSTVTTAMVALALFAGSARAGDLSNGVPGGLKDGRGAVIPVPAPVPQEETYKYYVGGFAGWGFSSSAKINGTSTGGESIELGKPEKFLGPGSTSIVVGRYITPSLRAELGMDFRMPVKVASGSSNYRTRLYGPGAQKLVTHQELVTLNGIESLITITDYSGPSQDYNEYNVKHTERAALMSHTFMFNVAHDFNREGKFNPYIGAGVGFVAHFLNRDMNEEAKCARGGNDIDDLYRLPNPRTCKDTDKTPLTYTSSGSKSAVGIGLAASLQAGLNYKLSERTHWDTGYRVIFMGGKVASAVETSNGLGTTTLSVGNRVDHELRTGLRFDLW